MMMATKISAYAIIAMRSQARTTKRPAAKSVLPIAPSRRAVASRVSHGLVNPFGKT